jgi:hypothetical protein
VVLHSRKTSQHGRQNMVVREPSTAGQSLHELPARPGKVHWGYFDASLAPALRVRGGDSFVPRQSPIMRAMRLT